MARGASTYGEFRLWIWVGAGNWVGSDRGRDQSLEKEGAPRIMQPKNAKQLQL